MISVSLGGRGYQAGLWKQAMSGRFPLEPYRERSELAGEGGAALVVNIKRFTPEPDES
jgi:hypothetical protein